MREKLSLPEMIETLQRTVAFHKERTAFHGQQQAHYAQQETLHREKRDHHAAELESASRNLEELRGMMERLGEVSRQGRAVPPETDEQALSRQPSLSKAVDLVLATWPPEVPFTASGLAAEVGRRYGAVLRRTVDPRAIASALRRRGRKGLVQEVREGRPFQEALYRKRG